MDEKLFDELYKKYSAQVCKERNIIGVTGSKLYTTKRSVQDIVFMLKSKFGDTLEVVSRGCKYGADAFVKKSALEFEIRYTEVLPYCKPWNQYCIGPAYLYDRKYNARHLILQSKRFVEYVDAFFLFIPEGKVPKDVKYVIELAKKCEKRYKIIN